MKAYPLGNFASDYCLLQTHLKISIYSKDGNCELRKLYWFIIVNL